MCKDSEPSESPPTLLISSAWCDRHKLLVSAGHWSTDRETSRFPIWEVELPKSLYNKYLTERLPFVKGYPKAEAVWASTPEAAHIRSEVHRECAALWGSCRQKSKVSGSSEFLAALGYGFRESKAQVYAFVITVDGILRFCESAAEVMHITMSDVNKEILFSGEFFLCHQKGRYWLCVTNNSGSYKPSKTLLQSAAMLFSEILGDVDVEALEMDNPRINELTTRHRGDPLHMGHSIHHTEPTEERSAAQIKSALVILGRGNEVAGYGGYPMASRQYPVAGHRRVKTWDSDPSGSAGRAEVQPASQTLPSQTQSTGQSWVPSPSSIAPSLRAVNRHSSVGTRSNYGGVSGTSRITPNSACSGYLKPASPTSPPASTATSGCRYASRAASPTAFSSLQSTQSSASFRSSASATSSQVTKSSSTLGSMNKTGSTVSSQNWMLGSRSPTRRVG